MFGQRLATEVKKARADSDRNFFVHPKDNLQNWKAFILGPQDSPYEEGVFELSISIAQVVFYNKGFPHPASKGELHN